jgi:hypothetical protein
MNYGINKNFLIRTAILAGVLFASNSSIVFADDDPLNTIEVEHRVSSRFKLSAKEMRPLRTLIRADNKNVVRFYWNTSDEQRSNYMSLWDKLRQARQDLDASFDPTLNNRQKAALKMAHTEFESRILYLWLEDYLDLLDSMLELDNAQANMVRYIFETDQDRRHQALIQAGALLDMVDPKWDQLSKKREAELEQVLDADQRRVYHSMGNRCELLA